jgi:uncharacterized protein YciI
MVCISFYLCISILYVINYFLAINHNIDRVDVGSEAEEPHNPFMYDSRRSISVFIVSLTYHCSLEAIELHLEAHIAYLEQQYALGHFLASGRKVPRTGGVILADMISKEALEAVLGQDPFKQQGLVEYDIIEFLPTKTCDELTFLRQTL